MLNNKHHISKDTAQNLNFSEIASKTEGYVAQDLNVLVDKATHAAWIRLGKLSFQRIFILGKILIYFYVNAFML